MNTVGFQLPFSYDPTNPIHVDIRRGLGGKHWVSVADANANVPLALRLKGLTVNILTGGSIDEYWWKSGITDSDLILKTTSGGGGSQTTYTQYYKGNGSTTTFTTTNLIGRVVLVDVGGAMAVNNGVDLDQFSFSGSTFSLLGVTPEVGENVTIVYTSATIDSPLIKRDEFTGTASQTVFTLTSPVTVVLIVGIGSLLATSANYSIAANILTLTTGVSAGVIVQILYL